MPLKDDPRIRNSKLGSMEPPSPGSRSPLHQRLMNSRGSSNPSLALSLEVELEYAERRAKCLRKTQWYAPEVLENFSHNTSPQPNSQFARHTNNAPTARTFRRRSIRGSRAASHRCSKSMHGLAVEPSAKDDRRSGRRHRDPRVGTPSKKTAVNSDGDDISTCAGTGSVSLYSSGSPLSAAGSSHPFRKPTRNHSITIATLEQAQRSTLLPVTRKQNDRWTRIVRPRAPAAKPQDRLCPSTQASSVSLVSKTASRSSGSCDSVKRHSIRSGRGLSAKTSSNNDSQTPTLPYTRRSSLIQDASDTDTEEPEFTVLRVTRRRGVDAPGDQDAEQVRPTDDDVNFTAYDPVPLSPRPPPPLQIGLRLKHLTTHALPAIPSVEVSPKSQTRETTVGRPETFRHMAQSAVRLFRTLDSPESSSKHRTRSRTTVRFIKDKFKQKARNLLSHSKANSEEKEGPANGFARETGSYDTAFTPFDRRGRLDSYSRAFRYYDDDLHMHAMILTDSDDTDIDLDLDYHLVDADDDY